MSIVIPADFARGTLKIANVDDSYNGVTQDVQADIDDYEPKFLRKLLGSVLYANLLAGLAEDPIPAKWTALANEVKPSIKGYVYYQHTDNKITETTGVGEVKPTADNANPASAWGKMVKAWNEMVDNNKVVHEFIIKNSADYPGFIYYQVNYAPFYVNGWFDYDFYFRNINCEVPEIYRYKNSLDI